MRQGILGNRGSLTRVLTGVGYLRRSQKNKVQKKMRLHNGERTYDKNIHLHPDPSFWGGM